MERVVQVGKESYLLSECSATQLEDIKDQLEREIREILHELGRAYKRYRYEGIKSDPKWRQELKQAKQRKEEQVQVIKVEQRGRRLKRKRALCAVFMDVAKEMMKRDEYQVLMNEARRRTNDRGS